MAKKVSLPFGTALLLQEVQLLGCLHPLGNDAVIQAETDIDHGAEDCGPFSGCRNLVDKRAVNLQSVQRKSLQIAEARVPDAKIVHGKLHPDGFQRVQNPYSGLGVSHQHSFGQLQL